MRGTLAILLGVDLSVITDRVNPVSYEGVGSAEATKQLPLSELYTCGIPAGTKAVPEVWQASSVRGHHRS